MTVKLLLAETCCVIKILEYSRCSAPLGSRTEINLVYFHIKCFDCIKEK